MSAAGRPGKPAAQLVLHDLLHVAQLRVHLQRRSEEAKERRIRPQGGPYPPLLRFFAPQLLSSPLLSFLSMRILVFLLATTLGAQNFAPNLYSGLQWRDIGPFRGGRTVGAAGIPNQPLGFRSAKCTPQE